MIQAPQTQYIPAQQPVQTAYQQQGAYNPVQYNQTQMPGMFYNYPTSSSYMPQQPYVSDRQQYNGVNIEILNPQGQVASPMNNNQMPAQLMPVQQPVYLQPQPIQQPVYTMPQQPVYAAPQQPVQQPIYNAPQQPVQQMPVPQPMINQEVPAANVNAQQPQAPVIEESSPQNPSVTPESFAARLQTDDVEAQKATIEEIAETVKDSGETGDILLDTQIYDALVGIIDKDTSNLEGPSPEVLELRAKPESELTEEEKEKASTPSPLEKAEINKQYSLYTISYMNERLNNQLEKKNGQALELKDLPCIEKVIDTAKSDPNPMLRISAIASLSHLARPEYKEDLNTIFSLAASDEDTRVQEAAAKASEALANS